MQSIPLIASGAAIGAKFLMGRASAETKRGESEIAAQGEEAAGVQREADRKERLAQALASQNASAGAGSIAAFEGSPLSVMKEDQRREATATEREQFMTKLDALSLRSRGKIAERQAKTSQNIGLLTEGAKIATNLI